MQVYNVLTDFGSIALVNCEKCHAFVFRGELEDHIRECHADKQPATPAPETQEALRIKVQNLLGDWKYTKDQPAVPEFTNYLIDLISLNLISHVKEKHPKEPENPVDDNWLIPLKLGLPDDWNQVAGAERDYIAKRVQDAINTGNLTELNSLLKAAGLEEY